MCCRVLQYVVVCCSVLQCVAVCYRAEVTSGLRACQCVAARCSVLQRVAVHGSVLHCVVACCSAMCSATERLSALHTISSELRCSVLQCVAERVSTCCRVLQSVAECLFTHSVA